MFDNSFWASGSGSWGSITIGDQMPYPGYPAYPTYPTYPAPYPGGVAGSFGLDSTIVLIGAVLVILLLVK